MDKFKLWQKKKFIWQKKFVWQKKYYPFLRDRQGVSDLDEYRRISGRKRFKIRIYDIKNHILKKTVSKMDFLAKKIDLEKECFCPQLLREKAYFHGKSLSFGSKVPSRGNL
jgi:hypothetical protein